MTETLYTVTVQAERFRYMRDSFMRCCMEHDDYQLFAVELAPFFGYRSKWDDDGKLYFVQDTD